MFGIRELFSWFIYVLLMTSDSSAQEIAYYDYDFLRVARYRSVLRHPTGGGQP